MVHLQSPDVCSRDHLSRPRTGWSHDQPHCVHTVLTSRAVGLNVTEELFVVLLHVSSVSSINGLSHRSMKSDYDWTKVLPDDAPAIKPAPTFSPPSLSPQMHHPIQMKPADSEKSNGEWLHAHTHTHTRGCT